MRVDQSYLLVLAGAVIVALGAVGAIVARPAAIARRAAKDSQFATSTEGMKVCPGCGMGNLWTERRCSACGRQLAG
jgi:hypothetical protein